jgi:hypothetical protein
VNPTDVLLAFSELVAADAALRHRLATTGTDHAAFAALCLAAAREKGIAFSEADLRGLLQQRHLFWMQRHIL